jgi:hypothetical protein
MKWTELQTEFLISVYPDHQTEHIAKVLGFTVHRVYNKAFKLRLKKSKEYLQIHGQRLTGTEGYNYRFKKGHEKA